jgi:hypothetical protein
LQLLPGNYQAQSWIPCRSLWPPALRAYRLHQSPQRRVSSQTGDVSN